ARVRGAGDRPGPPSDDGPRPDQAEGAGGGGVRRPRPDRARLPHPRRVPRGQWVPGRPRPSPLPAHAHGPADRAHLEGRQGGGPRGPPGGGPGATGPAPRPLLASTRLSRAARARRRDPVSRPNPGNATSPAGWVGLAWPVGLVS